MGSILPTARRTRNTRIDSNITDVESEQPPHRGESALHNAAPNWELVPFAVGCARCGEELRGRTEAKCPACGLEFDWAEAVPIEHLTCATCEYHLYGLKETRCPECGEAFTWQGALAAYYRNRQPYFEFQWRDRPFRSFMASWWGACRPNRLWRRVRLHDEAPPIGLGLLGFVGLAVVTFAPILLTLIAAWLISFAEAFRTSGVRSGYYAGPWRVYFASEWRIQFISSTLLVGVLGVGAGWGALLILWQSMRACRVRPLHSLRAVIYSGLPLIVVPVLPLAVWFAYDICGMFQWSSPVAAAIEPIINRVIDEALLALMLCCWFWTIRSIALAYRHYIRMPHAWGVAIASQLIVGLILVIAFCLL